MDHDMGDDDIFPYKRMASGKGHGQSQGFQKSSNTSFWQLLGWTFDFFTGPNFGVMVAILVIVLLQFKSGLWAFVTNAIEDGWQRTLLECMFGLRDATRAYFRMACELIRSFRHGISPPPSRNIIQSQRVISGGVPPPLVVIPQRAESDAETGMADGLDPSAKGQISEAGSSSPSTASSTSSVPHAPMGQEEIEPAFLNEKDYPPGWLVYHPVLGVVKKEEADQFDGDHPHLATHTSILSTSITASRH